MAVPEVLLSGNHAEIAKWRYQKQIEITSPKKRRFISKRYCLRLKKRKDRWQKSRVVCDTKNAIEQLLDEENDETVYLLRATLMSQYRLFEQMALIAYDKKLYAILVRKKRTTTQAILRMPDLYSEVDEKRQNSTKLTDDNIIFEVFRLI